MSYFILVVLFVVSLALRCGYELLKDSGKINPENKFIFVSIAMVMFALWGSWFCLCLLDPYKINLPGFVRWGGFALFVTGMALAIGAVLQLRGVENIKHLVTTGLFSKLRHPLYTGFVLWILGWSIYHGAFISLTTIGLLGIVSIFYWGRLEETRLLAQYGDVYQQYRKKTCF